RPRVRTLLSKRRRIRPCLVLNARTILQTSFRQKQSPNWTHTACKRRAFAKSRNFLFIAAPDPRSMKTKSQKKRLDILLVERGLAESRQKAQAMILAGEVSVDGFKAEKAGASIPGSARIEVTSRLQKYASRGGLKLEGALEDFAVNLENLIC